jgi:hypothetical protein
MELWAPGVAILGRNERWCGESRSRRRRKPAKNTGWLIELRLGSSTVEGVGSSKIAADAFLRAMGARVEIRFGANTQNTTHLRPFGAR